MSENSIHTSATRYQSSIFTTTICKSLKTQKDDVKANTSFRHANIWKPKRGITHNGGPKGRQ